MFLTMPLVDIITVKKKKSVVEDFLMMKSFFFIGCLIVEIHDHRSGDLENNNRTLETEAKMKRIVMKPTAESIWTDITLLSEEWGFPWTEDIALEVEAQILVKCQKYTCVQRVLYIK